MHRTSATHDLRDLVDTVTPKIESAVHTVAEKAPPAYERGRAIAAEKGAHLSEVLAARLPDPVVDRLPDSVVDRLPIKRSHRGRKMLVLGFLAALVGGIVVAARRGQGSHASTTARTPSYPRPVADNSGPVSSASTAPTDAAPPEAVGPVDPTDPLVEPGLNGRTD